MHSDPVAVYGRVDAARAKKILISILNWNGIADTIACVDRLLQTTHPDVDILVIDNGSHIDEAAAFGERFPRVEWVRQEENLGFAAGQNIGMRRAVVGGYASVLLLNNDCEIDLVAIRALSECLASDPKIAAVSPLIYRSDLRERPQMVNGWLDWSQHCSVRPSDPATPVPAGHVVAVPGTALLLRCAALEQIGYLDERYFAYYEDNDLCARIAAAGMKAVYCKCAIAWHDSRQVHQYSEMALFLSARNAWLFWKTHTPARFRIGMRRHLLAQSLYEIAMLQKGGAPQKCRAVIAGIVAAQRGEFRAPPSNFKCHPGLESLFCFAPYFLSEFLKAPFTAIRSKVFRKHPA